MSGRGDTQAELALARALEKGPLDAVELVAAVRKRRPDLMAQHEGALHAVLYRMVRSGLVLTGGTSTRGLALYRAIDTPLPSDNADVPQLEPVGAPSLARASLLAVANVRDPATRGRIQADVLAHLEALGQDTAAFGSARALRALLYRVDRGKPAVCFTPSGGEAVRRFVVHEGPWILGAAVIWVLLKLFVLQMYVIPSGSMVPALLKWDRVVVFLFHEGEAPPRWSVTTFDEPDKTYVKRLVGLPGENIALLFGDVFIDGERLVKPDEVREAMRAPLGSWDLRSNQHRGWTASTAGDGVQAMRIWRSGPFEAYTYKAGVEGGGHFAMHDGYADLTAGWSGQGRLALTLTRGPEERRDAQALPGTMTWSLRFGPDGIVLTETFQSVEGGAPSTETLDTRPGAVPAGTTSYGLSYVDGVLRAYVGNWRWQGARAAPDGPLQVALAVPVQESGPVEVRVARDLHYAHLGNRAVPISSEWQGRLNPHPIPAGHLFFLGDATTDSKDSRFDALGDIPVDHVVGKVAFRVWPLSRIGRVR